MYLPIQVSGLIEKLKGQCESVPGESEEIRERAEKGRVDFLLLVRDLKDEEDFAEGEEDEQEALQVRFMEFNIKGCLKFLEVIDL